MQPVGCLTGFRFKHCNYLCKSHYEHTQTNRYVSLFEKEGSQCPQYAVDQIHAWHQSNFASTLFVCHGCYCCEAFLEEIDDPSSTMIEAAFSEAFPSCFKIVSNSLYCDLIRSIFSGS